MYCYSCMRNNPDGTRICAYCGKEIKADNYPHHLKPGTVLDNKYLVGNSIGEGGFGITYVGLDTSLEMKIAIKEFYPSGYANRNNTLTNKVTLNFQNEGEYFRNGKESFLCEAKNIAKFHGEKSIVDVRAFFEENDTAYIIMEYLDGENLSEKLNTSGMFESVELFRLFLPVMRTLGKMHHESVIHRDISPENVRMVSDGTLKLMDFGSARYFAGMKKKTMSVQFKPGFAPFEQYNPKGNQGPWTDVYGLCATIYKCITGVTPADPLERCQTSSGKDILKKPSELGTQISEALESVLMYGMEIYPENRCKNMEELIRITEDALIGNKTVVGYDWSAATTGTSYKTSASDEPYKTKFANNDKVAHTVVDNECVNDGLFPAAANKSAPRKKNPVIITSLIVSISVIAAVAGVVCFYTLNQSKNNDIVATDSTEESDTTDESGQGGISGTETDDKVIMTNVSGKKLSDAQNELNALGLEIDTAYEESSEFAEGYVIRQSIQPDRILNKGDTVMLFVAKEASHREDEDSAGDDVSQSNYVILYCCASDYVTLRDRPSRSGNEITKIYTRDSVKYLSSTGDFYYVDYNGDKGYVLKEFFSQDKNAALNYGAGNSSVTNSNVLYCCASDYASLRSGASRDSGVITRISSREAVTYLGSSGEFYRVSFKGQTGYVLKNYFSASPDAPLNYGDN